MGRPAPARIDRARELLETSDAPMEAVARLYGLGTRTDLRTLFRRQVGVAPGTCRDTFDRRARDTGQVDAATGSAAGYGISGGRGG
ncbi:hypothetical protein GCM10009753_72820 [Streptantibioticus ferralitis]